MFRQNKITIAICVLFFLAYSVLAVVRHLHFGSYGFDLGIIDQIVWKYSHFKAPITTVQSFAFTSLLTDHVELIYILFAPFYWIYSSPLTILVLQTFFLSFSGLPVYFLAKKKKLNTLVCYSLLMSYLLFYGIQNAIWFDVHSNAFGAAFLAWFIYFLDQKKTKWAAVSFILAIISKEDMALLTASISFVYFAIKRDKLSLTFLLLSGLYLFSVFYIYFPHFTPGYYYQGQGGLFSNMQVSYLYDTEDKRNTLIYSLAWFGFLPLLVPLYLIPAFTDIAHYFVLAHTLTAAQGFFLHYRVTLAPLLILPSIMALAKFKKLNNRYIAVGILLIALFLQYQLHLPLSYLTKSWFWKEPSSVKNINVTISLLPKNSSVVSQNNITPHISHKENIFTLYPTTKTFEKDSPCGKKDCSWFRWAGNPNYLIVDTSTDWDARGFLTDRDTFIEGIKNLEKAAVIKLYAQNEDAYIYLIEKHP